MDDNASNLTWIFEFLWIPAYAGLVSLAIFCVYEFRKMSAAQDEVKEDVNEAIAANSERISELASATDKRVSLIEQRFTTLEDKLDGLDDRRREDRKEIMERIDKHSDAMYRKLDDIVARLPNQGP